MLSACRRWLVGLNFESLKPEEKVGLLINMVDTCVRICCDGLRDRDESIGQEELLEKVRKRIIFRKRRHHEV